MVTASLARIGVFLAAFLLFQVQPMAAKQLLVWYGGASMVWAVALFFFQAALLAGYAYAHGIASRLPRRRQLALHAALLLLAVALFLPPIPGPQWIPDPGGDSAALPILLTLLATVGLPFALLAATTPLLSHWLADAGHHRIVRWYAVSNAGSLLGLLLYPLVVAPRLSLAAQERLWSAGFLLTAALVMAAGLRLPARAAPARFPISAGFDSRAFGLAGFGSFALVAVTAHITRDLAAAPFLWVLPLALYLTTFILAFSGLPSLPRTLAGPLTAASAAACLILRGRALGDDALDPWALDAGFGLLFLFIACWTAHGMAAARRPDASLLTGFYLALTAGGAAGGLAAALLAPALFVNVFEYPLALALGIAIAFAGWGSWTRRLAVPATAAWVVVLTLMEHRRPLHAERTFYGVVRVFEGSQGTDAWRRDLWHGGIAHGSQWMAPERRREPTLYYHRGSGVELALNRHPNRDRGEPLRVGVVGLGAGALTAWARPGDHFRFHELDPAVERAARAFFSWLADSPAARTEVTLGDGRLGLQAEEAREEPRYDVLILDAFAGDAIPTHLLTAEAFDLYVRRLAGDGALAVHISNRHVDLAPVLRAQARRLAWAPLLMVSEADPDAFLYESTWVLLTRNADFLTDPAVLGQAEIWTGPAVAPEPHHLWTDGHANLLGVLR